MKETPYTREEEELVARALRGGRSPRCPRCGGRLVRQDVRPAEGVPYVRDRMWLLCEGCGRSVVLDRRRIGDEP